ncbi:hypothetical protein NSZ01_30670 [Nocardioides szechwanensis]|nr:hypothetical protein NSZ01_30670 [Nocardioides szechwanensis]
MVESLGRLCRAAKDDLDLWGATATLMPSVGTHAVVAASSEQARELEETQFGVGEGPSTDVFVSRRPVLVSNLEKSGLSRWPGWAPEAVAAGVLSCYSFPLHVGAAIFGVLGLYPARAAGLDPTGLDTALVFSEVATELLLDGSAPGDRQLARSLGAALDTHAHVYQAQGMVMVELGVSLAEALARMRAHAWVTGQDLTVLAGEIVAGRAMPSKDVW